MRSIHIPREVIEQACTCKGARLEYLVCVDWPELQLTEDQRLANALVWATSDDPPPHPDHSVFLITLDATRP